MKKYVIYTCLTGGYDELTQPLVIDEDFDYICFSNDIKENKVGIWSIKQIPYESSDNSRLSRYVKLLPHKVFKDYEYSLWIDANIKIINNEFYSVIHKRILEGGIIYQMPHPFHDCVYDEVRMAYMVRRLSLSEARIQFCHLKQEGMPKHYGLYENGVMLRKHNDKAVVEVSQKWWKEYMRYSKRDQLSLVYVYWALNIKPEYIFDGEHGIRNVSCLKLLKHSVTDPFIKRNKIIHLVGSNIRSFIRFILMKLFL